MGYATIRTATKDRIPSSMAYPVGAEWLTRELDGVPQLECLSIHFLANPCGRASKFQKVLQQLLPYCILAAKYRHIQPGVSAGELDIRLGFYEETWEIAVYPVPRKGKFAAQRSLSDAMPKVRDWFSEARETTWRTGRHSCRCTYDPVEESIEVSAH